MFSERDPYKAMGHDPRAPGNALNKMRHRSNPGKTNNNNPSSSICINCNQPYSQLESEDINYCNECASLQIECLECGKKFIPLHNSKYCHHCEMKRKYPKKSNESLIENNISDDNTPIKHEQILKETSTPTSKIGIDPGYDCSHPLNCFDSGDFRENQIKNNILQSNSLNHVTKISSSIELTQENDSLNCLINEYETVISKIIIYCINESTFLLDISETTDILKGLKSKKILTLALDELSTYSALSHCSEEWIKNFINELVSLNYLQFKYNSGKELLALNEKSLELLSHKVTQQQENPRNDSFVYDEKLFENLRKLRNQIAREKKFSPFIICNNATLKEMAMKMPQNDESMLNIKGVGLKFLENYGLAFQKVIKDYCHAISEN